MARLADIQAARLAGALLTGDAAKRDVVKRDAPFTLISRRKVRFWIGASATLAAIILVSWKVESHDSQSSGLSLGALSPIQEKDMKFTQAMSVAVAAGSICSGVTAQSTAVQWTTASGGNGHWYGIVGGGGTIGWHESRGQAQNIGADLASVDSDAEWGFIRQFASTPTAWNEHHGPWLGGYQDETAANFSEPAGGWRWVTGRPFVFTAWLSGQPSNDCDFNPENYLHMYGSPSNLAWNDIGEASTCSALPVRAAIIEYSADCNSDGIVDYGQILSGELIDTNSNGIPDICEIDPCPGDINLNSVVDAVDLAMVLTSWGTSGSEYPRADVNHDGIVNGPDLGALLGGWGLCP